jgi:hypothetical protein
VAFEQSAGPFALLARMIVAASAALAGASARKRRACFDVE